MYSESRSHEYAKRTGRTLMGSERSSRACSPDMEAHRQETLGYEDSLDVAFEHNNKLRVKIQQRMKESENLIANTFSQKIESSARHRHHHHHHHHHHHRHHENSHHHRREHGANVNNGNYAEMIDDKNSDREINSTVEHNEKHVELHFRSKNSGLGGLLDTALSNILHRNSKHDPK